MPLFRLAPGMMLASARFCASRYLPSAMRLRTRGSAPLALGLSVKLGWPAQMVSSFSCTRSTAGLPNTMPPRRPLPTGRAWVQVMAGRSYHSVCPCARTPVAASADANSKDSILFMSQFV